MLLSVILVSYNTRDLTLQTLQSVEADIQNSTILKGQTEVQIVDNNSEDDSVTAIKDFKKQSTLDITIIENAKNVGFAVANNQAIERAQGKYLFLLNSDTVVHQGAIETLVKTFEENPIREVTAVVSSEKGKLDRLGVLSPLLLQPNGKPQLQGGNLPNLWSLFTQWSFLDDVPLLGALLPSTQQKTLPPASSLHLHQLGWVPGTALMVRRAVIDEIGPLDQNIFMYGEDIEFCLRAKAHLWDVAVHSGAKVTHLGSASSTSANALMGEIKGYFYLWAKHKPTWQLPFLRAIVWWGCVLRVFLFGTMLQQADRARVYSRALREVLR